MAAVYLKYKQYYKIEHSFYFTISHRMTRTTEARSNHANHCLKLVQTVNILRCHSTIDRTFTRAKDYMSFLNASAETFCSVCRRTGIGLAAPSPTSSLLTSNCGLTSANKNQLQELEHLKSEGRIDRDVNDTSHTATIKRAVAHFWQGHGWHVRAVQPLSFLSDQSKLRIASINREPEKQLRRGNR